MDETKKLKDKFKIDFFLKPTSKFELSDNLYNGKERIIFEIFNCLICLKIVEKPIKCGDCSKLFCEKCIEDSLKNNIDRCTNCMSSPFKKDKIDLFVNSLLIEKNFDPNLTLIYLKQNLI